jgi:hypothetical protein
MTDKRADDDLITRAQTTFDETQSRLTPLILELVMSWIHPHAEGLPQLMGIQAALIRRHHQQAVRHGHRSVPKNGARGI